MLNGSMSLPYTGYLFWPGEPRRSVNEYTGSLCWLIVRHLYRSLPCSEARRERLLLCAIIAAADLLGAEVALHAIDRSQVNDLSRFEYSSLYQICRQRVVSQVV